MKKISYILITIMLTLQLCGCGANTAKQDTSNTEEAHNSGCSDGQEEPEISENILDVRALSELSRRDNSLDAYSWVVDATLQVEKPATSLGGTSRCFLGNTRAYYFSKNFLKDRTQNELVYLTAEGEECYTRFDGENLFLGIGPVCGTDRYIALDYALQEGGENNYLYFLKEKDENHETKREVPLDFLNGWDSGDVLWNIKGLAMDGTGVIHLVQKTGEEWCYLLISPEGEVITEYSLGGDLFRGFVPLYDGRVAFREAEGDMSLRTTLQYMDVEKGKTVTLAAPGKEIYCYTLYDDTTLVYANQDGVYRSDLSGNNQELLYFWINHGILLSDVSALQVDEEGRISLIYEDFTGSNYLRLEPTTEEVDLRQITLAVSPNNKSMLLFYQTAVAAFNRQYPTCHIELKIDYDKTVLMTELIAGKGPVLIDGFMVGFEEQEKLWEPLDTVMEQLGITEELLPSVLELGKINGTLYGVVMDFDLNTVVTGNSELKDWDYDTFLQCVEERSELEAIFNFYGGDYGTYFITNFISHGIEDNYLIDAETGTMYFDSDEFSRALNLAKKYCVRKEGIEPGKTVLTGKVLCNELNIYKPEHLALYRICYGEDINYIGYPAKNGAAHYIRNDFPLAVRKTASKEDKEIACAFIEMCLSYEVQSKATRDTNFHLSVRKDVLEEQINAMNKGTSVNISGFEQVVIGDDLNIELDGKTLHDLIDKAKPKRYFPVELRNILYEELEAYFADAITEDMLIEHLESRVGLYLDERK